LDIFTNFCEYAALSYRSFNLECPDRAFLEDEVVSAGEPQSRHRFQHQNNVLLLRAISGRVYDDTADHARHFGKVIDEEILDQALAGSPSRRCMAKDIRHFVLGCER
jgi:hypothetical protein